MTSPFEDVFPQRTKSRNDEMANLTDSTKVSKVDHAFGELIKGYVMETRMETAEKVLKVFKQLGSDSKVKLFDILTKTE